MEMLRDSILPEALEKRKILDSAVEVRKLAQAEADGRNRAERRAAAALESRIKELAP